ncbi:DUF2141 domain-containing protein [Fluviicola sp.]|jgi:uncharacterized protein (DUF2141 family)|uniref:DUF2141 domain-containing protein n=1 Tax=Fluviicola sp. TaxID=1917219 RepID=UPI002816C7C2|nr:DUF2141 domain-containing protein [Fluviicola sp.]MDR0801858.1 DUF2141 domain-containing protein [Fluviicola sp.]
MKRRVYTFILFVFVCAASFSFTSPSTNYYTITVKVINIRNNSGMLQLQVYRTAENFKKEIPWKVRFFDKNEMKNNSMTCIITGIEPGEYGVALLDDENSNKDMDYTMFVPDEGFGFSDYYHTAWSKPKFESFKFQLTEDKTVTIKVRYV